jgi:ribosomal protein S12 methylthiotransferase accessory factor
MKQWERAKTVDDSLVIATDTVKYFGLEVREKIYGHSNHPKTYHCQIFDHRRKVSFYGLGKGVGLQSKASALFEALEHYALYDFCQKLGADEGSYRLVKDQRSPLYGQQIPFARFCDVEDKEELFHPLFLIDPRYVKRPAAKDSASYACVAWQACDSGTASGTNLEEAGIHALNESIERHAYSLFLIEAFLRTDSRKLVPNRVRTIDKNSLSNKLQVIIHDVERDYEDEIMIFDMPNEFGVPSYFASMTRQPFPFQPRGCGSSLHPEYALERALLETLQPLQVSNDHMIANQNSIIDNFSKYPHLRRCAEANVLELRDKCENVDLPSASAGALEVQEQLAIITKKILSLGFEIYSVEVARLETGFACVRYLIPDLETFYLVQAGKFILPKSRILYSHGSFEKRHSPC